MNCEMTCASGPKEPLKNFDERLHHGCIFHGGQCNVTLTSWEHCSRLQQSRSHCRD